MVKGKKPRIKIKNKKKEEIKKVEEKKVVISEVPKKSKFRGKILSDKIKPSILKTHFTETLETKTKLDPKPKIEPEKPKKIENQNQPKTPEKKPVKDQPRPPAKQQPIQKFQTPPVEFYQAPKRRTSKTSNFILFFIILILIIFQLQTAYLYFQNQERKEEISYSTRPNQTEKILNHTVSIERKVPAENIQNIKDNYKNNLENETKTLEEFKSTSDFWEKTGSGIALEEDLILTNKHVVGIQGQYRIENSKNELFDVEVEAIHPLEDLALLKIKKQNQSLEVDTLKFSQDYTKGQKIIIAGNLTNLTFNLSEGTISDTERNFEYNMDIFLENLRLPPDLQKTLFITSGNEQLFKIFRYDFLGKHKLIQHNATTNYGSSGSGIYDTEGNLVGLNTVAIQDKDTRTFVLRPSETPAKNLEELKERIIEAYTPGTNFGTNGAIPAETIQEFIENYKQDKGIPFILTSGENLTRSKSAFWGLPTNHGFWLKDLNNNYYNFNQISTPKNSEIEKAGLKNYDIITHLNKFEITEKQTFGEILSKLEPETETSIKYLRKDGSEWKEYETTIKIGKIKIWTTEDLKSLE